MTKKRTDALEDADKGFARLWDRQGWDTATSYNNFELYFLYGRKPRSLIYSYRQYVKAQGRDETKVKTTPGNWRRWYVGQDSRGRPIDGAIGWEARADAYDKFIRELAVEEDVAAADKIRRAWQKTAAKAQKKIDTAVDAIQPGDLTPGQIAQLARNFANITLDVHDLTPPVRIVDGDSRDHFDLAAWERRRSAQLANLQPTGTPDDEIDEPST